MVAARGPCQLGLGGCGAGGRAAAVFRPHAVPVAAAKGAGRWAGAHGGQVLYDHWMLLYQLYPGLVGSHWGMGRVRVGVVQSQHCLQGSTCQPPSVWYPPAAAQTKLPMAAHHPHDSHSLPAAGQPAAAAQLPPRSLPWPIRPAHHCSGRTACPAAAELEPAAGGAPAPKPDSQLPYLHSTCHLVRMVQLYRRSWQ